MSLTHESSTSSCSARPVSSGRLTARHLAAEARPALRIALAGRSLTRLQDLAAASGAAAEWPLLVVDATDEDAVADLARRARVVVTTVGPYLKYGAPPRGGLRRGGHPLLRPHRRGALRPPQHRRQPRDREAHRCPDRPRLWLRLDPERPRRAPHRRGRPRRRRRARAHPPRRAQPEGRLQRRHDRLGAHPGRRAAGRPVRPRIVLRDPLGPCRRRPTDPAGRRRRADARIRGAVGVEGSLDSVAKASPVRRDADNGHFTGPFVMAAFNTRIVARSASLLGYGTAFRYVEYTDYGAGPGGAVTAGVVSLGLGAGLAGLAFGPTRARPRPGPAEARRGTERGGPGEGRFRMEVIAEATNGARYRTTVAAPVRPGLQRHGRHARPGRAGPRRGRRPPPRRRRGAHPATAIGMPLVERLRGTGSRSRRSAFPADRRAAILRRCARRRCAARAASPRSGW